ncbi:lytic transglycosylase domain-containing protein [uncultured Thiodictyon sp.]|uniref:lytic transglycosylase domain-containing protein n=1 Tax=uncultured Thiodictyon sp. TaxID=1846217 RepID=UPI0025E9A2F3|nr:lytic transglycosylase domain-containing protein [uncultured Thiodictyon sp.]
MPRVMPVLMIAASALLLADARADVYKYVDAKGNTYFTDAPLTDSKYRLTWKRESTPVVVNNRQRVISENRQRLANLGLRLGPAVGRGPAGVAALSLKPATARLAPAFASAPATDQSLTTRRARFERIINAYAQVYGLSPQLLHAVIRTESAYNHEAVSRAGAEGLMQLMPDTAARYGVKDSFNPVENIRGGAAYLHDLLKMFGQDMRLALAGYNAGENAVIRNGNQIPPYAETQNYVRKVLQYLWTEQAGG